MVERETIGQPRRGEISIGGHLLSAAYKVPRQQLRESILRVDPDEGVIERSRKPIKRKIYVSDGPHYCWHIDGNHKLIKWGIVIHGCVDGGCMRKKNTVSIYGLIESVFFFSHNVYAENSTYTVS